MNHILLQLIVISLLPAVSEAALSVTLWRDTFDGSKMEDRHKVAKELEDSFQGILDKLPELKPSERRWLDSEKEYIETTGIENVPTARLTRLFNSSEFLLDRFRNQILLLVENLKKFKATDRESGEIVVWWVVSRNLVMNENVTQTVDRLSADGLLPRSVGQKTTPLLDSDLGRELNFTAARIQEMIIGPYLVRLHSSSEATNSKDK